MFRALALRSGKGLACEASPGEEEGNWGEGHNSPPLLQGLLPNPPSSTPGLASQANKGLTLETSAFKPFTMANFHYQLS